MKVLIPVLALLLGGLVVLSVYKQDTPDRAPSADTEQTNADAPDAGDATADAPDTTGPSERADADDTATPAADADEASPTADSQPDATARTTPTDDALNLAGLHVRAVESSESSMLGAFEPGSTDKLHVAITPWGAGISLIETAEYRKTLDRDSSPYAVQSTLVSHDSAGNVVARIHPFSARAVVVNGLTVDLVNARWEHVGDSEYRATVVNELDQPIITIVRRYELGTHEQAYDITCRQHVVNHTAAPLKLRFEQYAQGDLPESQAYIGNQRKIIPGYFHPNYERTRTRVYASEGTITRLDLLGGKAVWNKAEMESDRGYELVWLAYVNRYFATVVHRPMVRTDDGGYAIAPLHERFPVVGKVVAGQQAVEGQTDDRIMLITLATDTLTVAPGGSESFDLALYAGPRKPDILNAGDTAPLDMGQIVVYSLGGCCTALTFQWLAKFLLSFLTLLHAVTFDWGVSIIILVIIVRLLLHPITRKAQINMMKMQRQMGAMKPQLEKLKKKYANDKTKLNQETMKLYREHGVNPLNMLGCLPMFLQMPIWIALYAMLFLAIELRHEPAFYGVFQAISGGRWTFLADLASHDNFIEIAPGGFNLPLIGTWWPYSLNILPILMGVVFYFQQKMTAPPPADEQQAQQQKMMKIMIMLFPIMLYPAPSGLTLYIMASTAAGIFDSYIVKRHIKREEEAGTLLTKKQPKPGSLMARISTMIEQKQRQFAQMQEQQQQKQQRGKNRRK